MIVTTAMPEEELMKTCENCGSAVYSLGCTWCNEVAYIEQQECFDALNERDRKRETTSKHVDCDCIACRPWTT